MVSSISISASADPIKWVFRHVEKSSKVVVQLGKNIPGMYNLAENIKKGSVTTADRTFAVKLAFDKRFLATLKKRRLSKRNKRLLLTSVRQVLLDWKRQVDQHIDNLRSARILTCWDMATGIGHYPKFAKKIQKCMDGLGRPGSYLALNKKKIETNKSLSRELRNYAESLLP